MEKAVAGKTTLTEKLSKVSITDLYTNIACKMGIKDTKNLLKFDCKKVLVGQSIFDRCSEFYKEQGVPGEDFAMMWLCYGPKASLEGYEVEVKDSWYTVDIPQ